MVATAGVGAELAARWPEGYVEPGPDSDVDLCIVADGAIEQLKAARAFRRAMRPIRPKPAFTLVPIAARRLEEKRSSGDFFFATVLREGVLLAAEN